MFLRIAVREYKYGWFKPLLSNTPSETIEKIKKDML